jgi:hypothetical protein
MRIEVQQIYDRLEARVSAGMEERGASLRSRQVRETIEAVAEELADFEERLRSIETKLQGLGR